MTETGTSTWRFPREFWIANLIELCERAAYYGCFIYLAVYLTKEVGYTDAQTGDITGVFAFLLYFMPTFMGALADKVGFRSALALAFALLCSGYAVLGLFPLKGAAIAALALIMLGGAIVKPVISGTAARCSDDLNRARAFSIFYWMVNIGAFTGKLMVDPIRTVFRDDAAGITGLRQINYYSAACAFVALLLVLIAFRVKEDPGKGKSFGEILQGLRKVVTNFRFMCLIVIVGGFWTLQGQLYATMPKYLLRMVSDFAKPGWLANVNPLVVVLCVLPVTHLARKLRPVTSIAIAMAIIPLSALSVALAPKLGTGNLSIGAISLHPVTLMLVIGIAFQGLAESFLSPRYFEYASKQAAKGEEGLYMGYCNLTTAFAWGFAFILSGRLLERWCPDPKVVAAMPPEQAATAYQHAHYIWYVYSAIGLGAFLALLIFRWGTDRLDRRNVA
ncbi:MAG: MFS transporter [Pseudomonadota bacterium]